MNIKRTLDTQKATYDLTGLTDEEFNTLFRAYEQYLFFIRHCHPSDSDSMWQKMKKLQEDRITII